MTADLRDILHSPYELGGTTVGLGLDCFSAACEILRRQGRPAPDGEPTVRAQGLRGESPTGFPPGWVRLDPPWLLEHGDLLLWFQPRPGSAVVHFGHVVTASEEAQRIYAVPTHRWKRPPAEVWRFAP